MAVFREMERREKVDEARKETERILAAQEAEVADRKVGFSTCSTLPLLSPALGASTVASAAVACSTYTTPAVGPS